LDVTGQTAELTAAIERTEPAPSGLLEAFLELSKARLSALVLLTTAIGFVLATRGPLDLELLAWTLLGTALAAFGANAFNQCIEVERDARMDRTRGRPLPSGRLSRRTALAYSAIVGCVWPTILLLGVHPLAALLALLTELIYVTLYTPMKVRSPLNTLVGAVCGALPPMIGWVAASGTLGTGAWILAAVLFVWQIPHFLALAWMYREDYRAGGFRMLPVDDSDGELTCRAVVLYSMTLVPVTLMLTSAGVTGTVYAVGAALLGVGFVALGIVLYWRRSVAAARRVFLASVLYLPILLALMVADRARPMESGFVQPLQSPTPVVFSLAEASPHPGDGG